MLSKTATTQMQYTRLGKTGLRVSRICLGLMGYGSTEWNGWVKNEEESLVLIKKAYDAGINFFDTADAYSNGLSEEILGNAIRQFNMPRDRIVIATKVFYPVLNVNDPPITTAEERMHRAYLVNRFGISRKHIFDAVENSLKRLGTDYIDVYQLHRLDKMGKVRYIGASSMYAWEFQKMNNVAEKNGWTKFVSMQNLYNLLYREEERKMIPYCLDQGTGSIPWSPLAGGQLAAKNGKTSRSQTDVFANHMRGLGEKEQDDAVVDRVIDVYPNDRIGREEHLYDIVGALDVNLSDEEIASLEECYVPKNLLPM